MAHINFVNLEMILFLFLFICVLNCESITFHIETDSTNTNNDGHDFINDQSLMNWIDAGYEDTCPKLRKEVMNRREIGDNIVFFCVREPKTSQCRLFSYLWGFLNSEYEEMH